jgi:hypothetical protein
MAASTVGRGDFVRDEQPSETRITTSVEIAVSASVRVFTETDLDNRDVAAVLNSTGTTPTVNKGSDGDPVYGFIEDIFTDGAGAELLILGQTKQVAYAAATEDPDVGDAVQSKGNGKVKQAIASPSISAGQRNIGRGHVFYKDTGNSYVKLLWP